jgi:KUP system potassium uptake protein
MAISGRPALYTMKEVFAPAPHGLQLTQANIFGIVSMILWGLIIVSLKYVTLVLRADNRGEGGIMALTAFLESVSKNSKLTFL